MASEQRNQPANSESTDHITAPLAHWRRPLAVATAIVFCISAVFPAVAAFVKDRESWPKWWGVLDVGTAFLLATLALAVLVFAQGKVDKHVEDTSYRAYRVLIHGIFTMLAVFFVFGDHIVWGNCLTGFAWRAWLLLYSLPAWLTVLGATPRPRASARK